MESLNYISGPKWAGVNYFTTQRSGGFSQGDWLGLNLGQHCGDNPDHVALNRKKLNRFLPSAPHWLKQVHGTDIFHASQPLSEALSWGKAPEADAAWTDTPNTVLAILTADCLPVVITDSKSSILGVAHAGWRGLANGVLNQLLLHLLTQRPDALSWRVWIGPAISQNAFEVGVEVRQIFIDQDPMLDIYFKSSEQRDKYYANLPLIAASILRKSTTKQIEINNSNACTFMEEGRYYSYRRQAQTGRIATLAWLE